MEEKIKLKLCPFCGCKNAEIKQDITGKKSFHVVCNNLNDKCPMLAGMPVWSKTAREAADTWNKRAEVSS